MKRNRSYRSVSTAFILWMLSGLYLLFSIGILKSTHFCMGREASVAFFSGDAESCACALFAGEGDVCCDDERDLLKIEESQKSFQPFQMPDPGLALVGQVYDAAVATADPSPLTAHFRPEEDVAPPQNLFKVYCSLVFYDDEPVVSRA